MHHNIIFATVALGGVIVFIATPMLVAITRKHPERRMIARLTVFAAFSFVLWTALLAWALSGKRDDDVISRYVARLRANNRFPLIVAGLVVVGAVGSAISFFR